MRRPPASRATSSAIDGPGRCRVLGALNGLRMQHALGVVRTNDGDETVGGQHARAMTLNSRRRVYLHVALVPRLDPEPGSVDAQDASSQLVLPDGGSVVRWRLRRVRTWFGSRRGAADGARQYHRNDTSLEQLHSPLLAGRAYFSPKMVSCWLVAT